MSPRSDAARVLQPVAAPRPAAEPGGRPRIVAIGGGTGLPNVLRGLRPMLFDGSQPVEHDRLVAVVATSDDGGSSGRLRAEFNIIPPGDIRNCLAALSDHDSQIAEIFQYRFDSGDGLNGHAIGNLVLTALADVTSDFARAVEIAARVIGAVGTVLPATGELVTCDALRHADAIVAGPGSLFTSILPPLLVPDVFESIHASNALRILVVNLMTEPGETDGYTVLDHVQAIERHLGTQLFDCVIYNTSVVPAPLAEAYGGRGARPIAPSPFELAAIERIGIRPIGVPLVSEHPAGKIRHHPDRLATAIVALAQGKLSAWRGRPAAGGA
jgi:2-phospho-L-lactate transferase/gluconeogenesis factor (CofD/UPF0052 family)